MRFTKTATSIAALLVAAGLSMSPALADEYEDYSAFSHPYAKLEGGVVLSDNVDFDDGVSVFGPFDLDLDTGWTAAAGFGWHFSRHVRGELEASYMTQDVDGDTLPFVLGGDVQTYTIMPMLFWDFAPDAMIQPFVGAGGGLGFIEPDVDFSVPTAQDDETGFAWQATAGFKIDHNEALGFSLRYRYLDAGQFELAGTEGDYSNHAILGGLTLKLGSRSAPPPPPPPPLPADEPVEDEFCGDATKVVYFDFDRSEIREDAAPVLDEAADLIMDCDTDQVVVEGHTDTSGSENYNEGLSVRRAEAVRDALIARGVPSDQIRIEAYGEREPAVATGDGVREQRNRRSVVVIRIR